MMNVVFVSYPFDVSSMASDLNTTSKSVSQLVNEWDIKDFLDFR